MLEGAAPPGDFRGRPMHPERLHAVAVALEATTQLLASVETFAVTTAGEVGSWPSTTDRSLTAATRGRLEAIRARCTAPVET